MWTVLTRCLRRRRGDGCEELLAEARREFERDLLCSLPPDLAAELPEVSPAVLYVGFILAERGASLGTLCGCLGVTRDQARTLLFHAGRRDGGRALPGPELYPRY
ncbi:hypothetical protein ACFXPA_30340 [Amycolatopsis sp. NPDC059090]|uniref:hypothetical protein n=1 Tax=unclassified Amycolatopsis TaxID=2618356 RepID=UPI0036735744